MSKTKFANPLLENAGKKHLGISELYSRFPNTSAVRIRARSEHCCAKCHGLIHVHEQYVRVVHGEKTIVRGERDVEEVMIFRRTRFHVECWREKP